MTESELRNDELIDLHRRVALADLSFGILHEMKNALGVVEGRGFLAASDTSDTQASHLQLMRSEASRAAKLIESYFSFARPSSTQLKVMQLNDGVTAALKLAEAHLRLNEMVAVKNLMPDLPPVNGDAVQLTQLTLNLLLNCIAAMTSTLQKTVTVKTGTQGQSVLLQVSNPGGFTHARLNARFRPFSRGTSQGSGLGLFVCQQIALRHHGALTLSNNETEAVVRLELPFTSW